MELHNKLVSIGMPVYNAERFIRYALDSLIAQDYTNFELIISNNASTDSTELICLEYARKDSRIKYFCNEFNEGALNNFNKVLKLSQGEYFMWAAHDDLWEKNFITTLVCLLNRSENNVIAFSGLNNINDVGEEIRQYPHIQQLMADNIFSQVKQYLLQPEYFGKANLIYGLMRKEVINNLGGFKIFTYTESGADMLFVFNLLLCGNLCLTRDVLFHKRLVEIAPSSQLDMPLNFFHKTYNLAKDIVNEIYEIHGYLDGYIYILNNNNISFEKQLLLNLIVFYRKLSFVIEKIFFVLKITLIKSLKLICHLKDSL